LLQELQLLERHEPLEAGYVPEREVVSSSFLQSFFLVERSSYPRTHWSDLPARFRPEKLPQVPDTENVGTLTAVACYSSLSTARLSSAFCVLLTFFPRSLA
jgi:hypothetical protein